MGFRKKNNAHLPSFRLNRKYITRGFSKLSQKKCPRIYINMSFPQGRSGVPGVPGTPGQSVRGPKGEPGSCACSMTGGQKGDAGRDGLPGKHFLLS